MIPSVQNTNMIYFSASSAGLAAAAVVAAAASSSSIPGARWMTARVKDSSGAAGGEAWSGREASFV